MHLNRKLIFPLFIAVSAALLFIPLIGKVHLFDWDEINFAESAREMIVTGDYSTVQINYAPFCEKPPLFIWLQTASMDAFGINEFAARFPNSICGILTLLVLFFLGRKLYDNSFGMILAFTYIAGILPFFYFKSGLIDPWFNLFILLGIVFIYFHYLKQELKPFKYLSISAFFIGLAILTKGPVALLITILVVLIFMLFSRNKIKFNWIQLVLFFCILILTAGSWFIIQLVNGDYDIVVDFIKYQIQLFSTKSAGHGGSFFYHFIILFFLVFPTSVIALKALIQKQNFRSTEQQAFRKMMVILFWVVLILFSIVKTKIIHYSSLCYFPLSFLAASEIYDNIKNKQKPAKWQLVLLFSVSLIYAVALLAFFLLPLYKNIIIAKGWIHDSFEIACLNTNVGFNIFELAAVIILPLFIIVAYRFFSLGKNRIAWITIISGSIVFNFISLMLIAPKAEQYSQNSLIEFCSGKQNPNYIVTTKGFFSYAPLFYAKLTKLKKPISWPISYGHKFPPDKKVFVIMKMDKDYRIIKYYHDLKLLYVKNGYVFLEKVKPVINEVKNATKFEMIIPGKRKPI
jgi:4-amino-4-deoxy-L-arabinose transferase-like glycosyltransferase